MNPPTGIKSLPNGQWVLENDTHISRWAEQHGSVISDPHLFRFLDPYLHDTNVIWDIGAFIGDHTRHYCNLGKKVVALEPNPLAFQCLQHNCPEALTINAAASDEKGTLFYGEADNAGASRIAENGNSVIEAVVLDDLILPAPDFVKVDVEGWEVNALWGMRRKLAAHKPMLYVEINRGALAGNNKTPEDVFALLEDFGYTKQQIYPNTASYEDAQYDVLFLP